MDPHDETFNGLVIPLARQTNIGGELFDLVHAVEHDRDWLDKAPLSAKASTFS